jgi:hypothetical protein
VSFRISNFRHPSTQARRRAQRATAKLRTAAKMGFLVMIGAAIWLRTINKHNAGARVIHTPGTPAVVAIVMGAVVVVGFCAAAHLKMTSLLGPDGGRTGFKQKPPPDAVGKSVSRGGGERDPDFGRNEPSSEHESVLAGNVWIEGDEVPRVGCPVPYSPPPSLEQRPYAMRSENTSIRMVAVSSGVAPRTDHVLPTASRALYGAPPAQEQRPYAQAQPALVPRTTTTEHSASPGAGQRRGSQYAKPSKSPPAQRRDW